MTTAQSMLVRCQRRYLGGARTDVRSLLRAWLPLAGRSTSYTSKNNDVNVKDLSYTQQQELIETRKEHITGLLNRINDIYRLICSRGLLGSTMTAISLFARRRPYGSPAYRTYLCTQLIACMASHVMLSFGRHVAW